MDSVKCIVVGAGVVGLAIARALSLRGHETIVVEAERIIGSGVSSRNSEVIHAGIYYPTGSLKARFCVEGRKKLYAYCRERGIPHRRCGKLIVAATEEQREQLEGFRRRAAESGVDDLRHLSAEDVLRMEPDLRCVGGLESPSTGIIDSHALMLSLRGDAEAAGAVFAFETKITNISSGAQGLQLCFHDEAAPSLEARLVVNSAGLNAQAVASSVADLPKAHIPPIHYAKGNYFGLAGKSPFSRLIYPAPEEGGLGTHLTLDLGGRARFGPDVQWIDKPDFVVEPKHADKFYRSIRVYWPGLPEGALYPDYAGVRPKLTGPGEPDADFIISGPANHNVGGLINLFGIESPGLTAALAIGEHVAGMAEEAMDF